jgi:hypothetical protein
MMKLRHWITVVALLALVVATVVGMVLTEGGQTVLPTRASKSASKQPAALVDQRPLQTARKLAALASTPEERDFANEALRVADYEVDLAFADALREATEHPPIPTQEQRDLMSRNFKAESVVKGDQELIARLTLQLAGASETAKDDIQDQIDVAKAQLELDQDELDDARQDLLREGGNPQGKIQQLLQEHEAGAHSDPASANNASHPDSDYQAENLYPQIRSWFALHEKRSLLAQARQDALDDVPALTRAHDTFDQRVREQEQQKQVIKEKAAGLSKCEAPADGESKK